MRRPSAKNVIFIMRISIHPDIFKLFPGFSRGVIVASGVTNLEQNPALEAELRATEDSIRKDAAMRDYKNLPRVKSWLDAFTQMGLNPGQTPPSISSLMKRVVNGGRTPFISSLVTIFNIASLQAMVPCGGDDVGAVSGDLCLRKATGNESYIPLGKPEQRESPAPGEIIYCDSAGQVLCRRWCSKNGHATRIQPATSTVAINVDALVPVGPDEVRQISDLLADCVKIYCGGTIRTFLLCRESPEAEV